jgi:pyruvate/2-oxoglutarate/acetoin dehydrogenase E1 component
VRLALTRSSFISYFDISYLDRKKEKTMAIAIRQLTYAQAVNEALRQEMRRDPRVILMGEDVAGGAGITNFEQDDAWGGVLGVTKGLVQEFGRNRVLDTPITEAGFIGAAVGAATTGLRPVVELMFVDFFGVCWDMIFDQGAKLRYMFGGKAKCPLVIRTMIGAGMGAAGQHSGCHYSVFSHMPGIKTVVPSTPADAKGLLTTAIRDDDLVVVFENKMLYAMSGEVPEGEYSIPFGKADIKREGSDVTIVAISRMVHQALAAADALAADGISAEIVDPRTLSPLDEETILQSVAKTHRLIIVDEDNPRCSAATDIAALVADKGFTELDAPIKMVTAPHTPVPFSPPLEQFYIPSPERIVATVQEIIG